jgi:hypothetical protein
VCNPDVPLTNYLIAIYWLAMVEVVYQVVKLRYLSESNGVQVPHNDRFPLLQSTTPFFHTSFNLELLSHSTTVLAVYDHELFVLDLTPFLGLR